MNYQFIPIDSVLYDLSLIIEPPHYNAHKFKEWAIQGYRKLQTKQKYAEKVALLQVAEHKVELPEDVKFVNQIAYKENLSTEEQETLLQVLGLDDYNSQYINQENWLNKINQYTPWKPLRKSTNSFIYTVNLTASIFPSLDSLSECCDHEYTIDQGLCLTTTLRNGYIWISYLAYATDDKCRVLIPDDEDLKDAITHYCLYKFWHSKVISGDRLAVQEREWNLGQFETLLAKSAAKLNSPDTDDLENLRGIHNRLLPRQENYRSFFSKNNQIERQ